MNNAIAGMTILIVSLNFKMPNMWTLSSNTQDVAGQISSAVGKTLHFAIE